MNKSTLIALLIFTLLALVTFSTLREKPERGVRRWSLEHVDAAAVDRLLLGSGEEEIELKKQGDEWQLDGLRADGTTIDRVVATLAVLRSSDLASRSAGRFAELEVDDEKGKRVRLYSGADELADLVIGAPSPSGGSYVRDGEEVYSVAGVNRASYGRERDGWVEKRAFFDDFEDVIKVRVSVQGGTPYALVKKDERWELEDASLMPSDQRFDADQAKQLVRSLVSVRASEVFAEEPEASGFGDGVDKLEYHVEGDDAPRVLVLGATKDAAVYARSSQRDHVLALREFSAKNLRKTLAGLRDFNFVDLDMAHAKRLEIVDGASRLVLGKGQGGWKIDESSEAVGDDFELDLGAPGRRVATIGRLKGVAESSGAIDVAEVSQSVRVTLEDDTVVAVGFGAESKWQERDVVEAKGNVDDKTYLVDKSARDRVLAGLDSFKKREAPAPGAGGLGGLDPAALQNLPPEVRNSLLKKMAEERQREEMMKRAMEAAGR